MIVQLEKLEMSIRRINHFVPRWYQKLFLSSKNDQLYYLDLFPANITLPNGQEKKHNNCKKKAPSISFCEKDLYTTFFGNILNDEIEVKLFGEIDNIGVKAVNAFINGDASARIENFSFLLLYLDAQKLRTPKGLDWIKKYYTNLDQNSLMREMQALKTMNCTLWAEGVKEIVSAEHSEIKFIISDHPITIYNYACPPNAEQCFYPDDPSIKYKASQTIFALDMNHCLILTNYEYAKDPKDVNPLEYRTNATYFRQSLVNTEKIIRVRSFNDEDVKKINYIIKSRAKKYIAGRKNALYPENDVCCSWSNLSALLLPPKNEVWQFGGEMYIGFGDGSTKYQDAFGRNNPQPKKDYFNLQKKVPKKINFTDLCGCGSGKQFGLCCRSKKEYERPSWYLKSIRERNIDFCFGIENILGLSKGKDWDDIRKEFNDEHVKQIHELYGFLWPIDTDIMSLLPKSDKVLRALYIGHIDPRLINIFAINSTLYFDEVIIQSPFFHPQNLKPDFNPIHNPQQYKEQTLKNIFLFFTLYPFIQRGYINLIPDPCTFIPNLHQQILDMANTRANFLSIDNKDSEILDILYKDDFERIYSALPRESLKSHLSKNDPKLNLDELEKLVDYMFKKRQDDPFALLQDDVYTKDKGQFQTISLSPNYEMSLFLCQIMGAIPVTDSRTRWNEMNMSQYKYQGIVNYQWQAINKSINKLELMINIFPETILKLRQEGAFKRTRHILKKIYLAIQGEYSVVLDKKLSIELTEAYKANCLEINSNEICAKAKINSIIPKGGILDLNIQRLILMHGSKHCLKKTTLAILLESP